MRLTRRAATFLCSLPITLGDSWQFPDERQDPRQPPHLPKTPDEDAKLPNGKSQKDAIAKQNHDESLKDAEQLLEAAKALKDELEKAGSYVVPVSSVKKTEEIEKLARRIRGRLKG